MPFYTILPVLLNMSITASVVIVIVLFIRLLLKKAPKVISYALWSIVLIRLLCPVSFESDFSLFGLLKAPLQESNTLTSQIEYIPESAVLTENYTVILPNTSGDTVLPHEAEQSPDPLKMPFTIAAYVWMAGILAMAVYTAASYSKLRRKLITASYLRENIYLADGIVSPFVMGLIRPKIYLPASMEDKPYIVMHEQHHIRRGDHIVKLLAYIALCIHWFNPMVWIAFITAGKDMEMSCDEAVIKKMGDTVRADYAASLLSLAAGRRITVGMPLAFGEGNTKGRIRNLANWKKPALLVILLSVILCAAISACLLTNPSSDNHFSRRANNYKKASILLANGEYDAAKDAFEALGKYKDSARMAVEAVYRKADKLSKNGKYEEAISLWNTIIDYSFSTTRIENAELAQLNEQYNNACNLMYSGDYIAAVEEFDKLGDYLESAVNLLLSKYSYARYAGNAADSTTYQYVLNLIEAEYPDAQRLYDELYAWKAAVKINGGGPEIKVNEYTQASIEITGGEYGAEKKVMYIVTYPDGTTESSDWMTVKVGDKFGIKWTGGCGIHASELGDKLTVQVFDENNNRIGMSFAYVRG